MSHLLFYMLVYIIPLKTFCELILSEEALGDIQLSDLQARADLVEELTIPSVCKRQVKICNQDLAFLNQNYFCSRCSTIGWTSLEGSTGVKMPL